MTERGTFEPERAAPRLQKGESVGRYIVLHVLTWTLTPDVLFQERRALGSPIQYGAFWSRRERAPPLRTIRHVCIGSGTAIA